jgi:hypothetical protein
VTRLRRGPEARSRRRLAPVCIAGLLLASLVCAPVAAAEAPAFCHERHARDYEAPLREMPRQNPPPEGELPFGPRNFSVFRPEWKPVVLQGSNLGYRFAAKHAEGRKLHLDWELSAVLRSVSPRGQGQKVIAKRYRRVGDVDDLDQLDLTFPAGHAGYYRIDIRIKSFDSGESVRYREYWRVLKRSVRIEIATSAPSLHRGESIWGEIRNPGASRITAPVFLELQRYEEGEWVEVEQPPTPASVMGTSWWLDPGENGTCHRYDVPADGVPGLYRFVDSVYAIQLQRRVTVTAPFLVEP